MLIELLSPGNYISFNIKLANVIGLHSAIYLSELLNINEKAIRKNKITKDAFILDREYIRNRTTLSIEEQFVIEKTLFKIGILKQCESSNSIQLDITALTSIMMSADEDLLRDITKIVDLKKNSKQSKAEKINLELKTNIITTNPKLRAAYYEWIDAVQSKDGFLHKKAVTSAQSLLEETCKNNTEEAIKILEIATINGYRDMAWAVNNYKKNYRPVYTVKQPIQQQVPNTVRKRLDDEVF